MTVTGSSPAEGTGIIVTRPTGLRVELEATTATGVVCDGTAAGKEELVAGAKDDGVMYIIVVDVW